MILQPKQIDTKCFDKRNAEDQIQKQKQYIKVERNYKIFLKKTKIKNLQIPLFSI